MKNGGSLAKACEFYKEMVPVSKCINEVTRVADPTFHEQQTRLRDKVEELYPVTKAMNAVDPLLMEGREILMNRRSGLHRDSTDPHKAWAGLLAAGDFTSGGQLLVPELNLRLRLLPGDFVMVRGRALYHAVEDWDGGQRICIPHFTHTSLWRQCGMGDEVTVS